MRRNPEITGKAGRWTAAALAVVLAAGMAGCESASNLSEYEKLVARRRAVPEAPRPEMQAPPAAPQQPAAVPAKPMVQKPAPAPQKPVPAAQKPNPDPIKKPAPQAKPLSQSKPALQPKPESKPAPVPVEAPVAVVEPPAPPVVSVEPPPPPAVEPAPVPVPSQPAAPARSSVQGVYTLKKGDVVQVVLRGIPEQMMIDDSLDEFGMISLPFLNEVYAEGFTASELEQRIRQLYRDSQIYPNVTVQVQVPTRFYYMQGEIRGPGRVQLIAATRLSQAIAAAGG
ncbi:MAG: polysaccharide biosynthesis/export family protein, partial [Kiritimatiellae bacterium]|nr:polysaccharide biosynthesis/export family protein [Kiritimatiellia bacterium]